MFSGIARYLDYLLYQEEKNKTSSKSDPRVTKRKFLKNNEMLPIEVHQKNNPIALVSEFKWENKCKI